MVAKCKHLPTRHVSRRVVVVEASASFICVVYLITVHDFQIL